MGVLIPEVGYELSPPCPWPEVEEVGAKIQIFKFFLFFVFIFRYASKSRFFENGPRYVVMGIKMFVLMCTFRIWYFEIDLTEFRIF